MYRLYTYFAKPNCCPICLYLLCVCVCVSVTCCVRSHNLQLILLICFNELSRFPMCILKYNLPFFRCCYLVDHCHIVNKCDIGYDDPNVNFFPFVFYHYYLICCQHTNTNIHTPTNLIKCTYTFHTLKLFGHPNYQTCLSFSSHNRIVKPIGTNLFVVPYFSQQIQFNRFELVCGVDEQFNITNQFDEIQIVRFIYLKTKTCLLFNILYTSNCT